MGGAAWGLIPVPGPSGLNLNLRRKHSLNAQEGWLVLTDVAHNLLAWLQP